MKLRIPVCVLSFIFPFYAFAAGVQSYYCPGNHGYINIGMTPEQVISSCGEPLSKQESNQPVLEKIPVQQLIYNNLGTKTPFQYQGRGVLTELKSGSGGVQLVVNIVNNQVKDMKIDGNNTNAESICGNTSIQIGDPAAKVYGACGSPSIVNNTFIEQIVPTAEKPKIWIYQPGQYQATISLTFVNGKLQSINQ